MIIWCVFGIKSVMTIKFDNRVCIHADCVCLHIYLGLCEDRKWPEVLTMIGLCYKSSQSPGVCVCVNTYLGFLRGLKMTKCCHSNCMVLQVLAITVCVCVCVQK